jgi:hypothetical protein
LSVGLQRTNQPLALSELSARVFACIALSLKSKAAQRLVAHALLSRQPDHRNAVVDGDTFHVATFGPTTGELAVLRDLVCVVGGLATAVVYVRGRHYPPGQHTRLYQWLSCFHRMLDLGAPIGMCDYVIGQDERHRLPCSLLGSFCGHDIVTQPSGALPAHVEALAAREGFDRCPRYHAERLIRVR